MPIATINGFACAYEVRGHGRPLVLLHGGMGTGADWSLVFPNDPAGFSVVAPDLRGHGKSTNPPGVFTFRQCAADVLALLDHLELETVDAIGLSLGAKTLLHVATQQPQRIGAMVLVSATPRFEEPVRAMMRQFTPESLAGLSEAERKALRARHVHGDEQLAALYAMMRGFAERSDEMHFTPASLTAIRARTLIVHGDRDPLYPIELALELYRGIPDSALWVVPNGGHGPIFGPLAQPFAEQATRFLQQGIR